MEHTYHRLLERQLAKVQRDQGECDYETLFHLVSDTYSESDREIEMTNHAMNLMSRELLEVNKGLQKQAEELKIAKERFELAALGANDGLWDWDIKNNKVFYSARWKEMLGYDENTPMDDINDWFAYIHPDFESQVRNELESHLEGKSPRFESEYQIRTADGEYRWMLARGIASRDSAGNPIRIAGSQTDVTERKHYEEQLEHAAFHDPLTSLPNRALFLIRLEHAINKAKRSLPNQPCGAVLFLDLDRFKVINDSLGHMIGDKLLQETAKRLETVIRPGDTLARLGGDEFIILLEDINTNDEAENIADRVVSILKAPFDLDGELVTVSASIGVVLITDQTTNPDLIMRNADLAMYNSKTMGRNRYSTFNDKSQNTIINQIHLEQDLRLALERKELFLVYQPVIDLATGKISSFEALLRWKHPKLGLIPPINFIPLAEESGLIQNIGEFVLQSACDQLKDWRRNYPEAEKIGINVNLSLYQLADPPSIKRLTQIIQDSQLPPGALKLELTESAVAHSTILSSGAIQSFKESAVELCIDDFGTGYSSLNQLSILPFDIVKIDRSFISWMHINEKNYRMISGIISLSHDLGFKVVAEGVENIVDYTLLRELKCDFAQGYYFSKPVGLEEAAEYIQKGVTPTDKLGKFPSDKPF
jgi:diguanylate cyclase (GGDEF)-like protein/PAS domain S-box-containing protein